MSGAERPSGSAHSGSIDGGSDIPSAFCSLRQTITSLWLRNVYPRWPVRVYFIPRTRSFKGVSGAGFLFIRHPTWTLPNPVGLSGYFEGHCPPYYQDMRAAVEHLVSLKFGQCGTFDPQRPGPFRENVSMKTAVERYSSEMIECAGEIAQYIYGAYGKFPATTPSVYCNIFVQAHHLDMDFYDQFYSSDAYLETHRQHFEKWHGKGQEIPGQQP